MADKRFHWTDNLLIFVFFLSLYVLICRGAYYSMDEMARYGVIPTTTT